MAVVPALCPTPWTDGLGLLRLALLAAPRAFVAGESAPVALRLLRCQRRAGAALPRRTRAHRHTLAPRRATGRSPEAPKPQPAAAALQARAGSAHRMPHGEHFERIASGPVVDVIPRLP